MKGRPVFGKMRYMSDASTGRRFDSNIVQMRELDRGGSVGCLPGMLRGGIGLVLAVVHDCFPFWARHAILLGIIAKNICAYGATADLRE
jgi:hypothetical protein